MSLPQFNIGGLASGLDTAGMINGLMRIERIPITRMQGRQNDYRDRLQSWSAITTKVSDFREKVDSVRHPSDFASFVSARSSNEDIATVEITGTPTAAAVSVTVEQLAASHQVTAGTGFADGTAAVGAGSFTITTSSGDTVINTTATTTLDDLARAINNDSDLGVSASVIEVSTGDSRLLLTAEQSGADAAFTTSSTITALNTTSIISQAADAQIRLGDAINGIVISRPTNTITGVIEGVTLDLKTVSTEPVTFSIERDTDAAKTAIVDLVNSANGVLDEIDKQTAYDADNNRASPLTNDSTARDLTLGLRNVLGETFASGTSSIRSIGDIGISLGQDGRYSVDETKLTDALTSDFDTVMAAFTRDGSSDDTSVQFLSATGETVDGTYAVTVDGAATSPVLTGSAYSVPAQDETFDITLNSSTLSVTITAGSTLSQALDQINAAVVDTTLSVVEASDSGGAISLAVPTRFGSATTLSVANDAVFGLNGSATGVDVTGTIGGEPATGQGQRLTADSGSPKGLSVRSRYSTADLSGGPLTAQVTISQGLGGRLDAWLDQVEGVGGDIAQAREEWDNRISDLDDQIQAFEGRMVIREAAIRRQFTAMETALSNLQDQSRYLAGLASGLPTG